MPHSFGEVLHDVLQLPEFESAQGTSTSVQFVEFGGYIMGLSFVPPRPRNREEQVLRTAVHSALLAHADKTGDYTARVAGSNAVLNFSQAQRPRKEILCEFVMTDNLEVSPLIAETPRIG